MDRRRGFGRNLARGLAAVGRGVQRFTKGTLGVLGSPVIGDIAQAINPVLGSAARAVGGFARAGKRAIEAAERRDPRGFGSAAVEAIGAGRAAGREFKRARR